MFLTQSLIKKTIFYTSSFDRHEADKHGGYEMGTWGFRDYLKYFEIATDKKIRNGKYYKKRGVCFRTFTKKEQNDIADALGRALEDGAEIVKGKLSYRLYKDSVCELTVTEKWVNVLHKLFSSKDRVLWYST